MHLAGYMSVTHSGSPEVYLATVGSFHPHLRCVQSTVAHSLVMKAASAN